MELPTKLGLDPWISFRKLEFTDGRRMNDGRRTTDACAMTVALLAKSSRAKNTIYLLKLSRNLPRSYNRVRTFWK